MAQRALASRIASQTPVAEREALLEWAQQLVAISRSSEGKLTKAQQAVGATLTRKVAWPVAKLLAAEIQRLAWDDRGLKSRWALGLAGAAAVVFGTQGAGIAALGGAIGVPLWLVFGAGGAFLGMLHEELLTRSDPPTGQPGKASSSGDVVDVTATVVAQPPPSRPTLLAPVSAESDGRLNVGDVIRCGSCGHERLVSAAWLRDLSSKNLESGPMTASEVTSKLRCSICSAKSFSVVPS